MKEFLRQNIAIAGSVWIIFLTILFEQFFGQLDQEIVMRSVIYYYSAASLAVILQNMSWFNQKNYRLIFLNLSFLIALASSFCLVLGVLLFPEGFLGGDGMTQGFYLAIVSLISMVIQLLIWLTSFIFIITKNYSLKLCNPKNRLQI